MPKVICKYKNYDDFYKNRASIWAEIKRRMDIHATDSASFEKLIFQGKAAIRLTYDNHVEDAPELKKARARIAALEKEKARTFRFVQGLKTLEDEISAKHKMLRLLESQLRAQKKEPKTDPNYRDTALELKKLLKAQPAIKKKIQEYEKALAALEKAEAAYDPLKKQIESKIPMSVQTDGKNMLLYIGGRPEASIRLKATLSKK
ncbi:hypothetical protein PsAD2_00765 [Pseudovibrio axinellae]|uniref:Chromosome partition protein Smc n=1 Tax=Pseudovibrio axinellae TaxID=989403 RepID=A0A166ARP2_9HYPH|nr:hypothetical protein [Pseudovibrio axinellae]KZL21470.1 hypothetical protein PsAD2_00765 [Pseudovibrio axinellae]SER06398.1 hypothetical protein SAMN05421798_10637 [Pseudovibrio axinellae]